MLKVALGLIIREHRRYFPCSADIAASITLDDGSKVPGTIKNLSEGGAAIQASTNFKPGNQVRIDFRLTGAFSIGSEVCWCDNNGRSGLRFLRRSSRAQLGSLATNSMSS